MKKIASLLLLIIISGSCYTQDLSDYEKHIFKTALPYRLLRPVQQDSTKKYPLVIFLHGAFEKGTDNELQLNIGGRFFLRPNNRQQFPSYVLFPQCPQDDSWAYFETTLDSLTGQVKKWDFPFKRKPTNVTQQLFSLIDSLRNDPLIDTSKIYIAGLSQGGMGVLDMIARKPDLFAAGISMCGAGDVTTTKFFKDKVSLWLFHGDKDDVVPVEFSRKYYGRLKDSKRSVRYNEYAGVMHPSWVNAFAEPELLSWLFSQYN
jgi:predicted peptidase